MKPSRYIMDEFQQLWPLRETDPDSGVTRSETVGYYRRLVSHYVGEARRWRREAREAQEDLAINKAVLVATMRVRESDFIREAK